MIVYKKYFLYAFLLFMGCVLLSKVSYFFIKNDVPEFFEEYINKVKSNPHTMDEIGGFSGYEYSFDKKDLVNDTLEFTITINGNENVLNYKGIAVKNNLSEKWKIATIKKE
jgi:hypothetical protein